MTAAAAALFLTVSTYSLHLDAPRLIEAPAKVAPGAPPAQRARDINARTFGGGIGYRVNPQLELMAGAFENSLERTSRYAVAAWWFADYRVAVAGGYLDGYDRAPVGVALVGRWGPARLVVTPGGVVSLWFALELED